MARVGANTIEYCILALDARSNYAAALIARHRGAKGASEKSDAASKLVVAFRNGVAHPVVVVAHYGLHDTRTQALHTTARCSGVLCRQCNGTHNTRKLGGKIHKISRLHATVRGMRAESRRLLRRKPSGRTTSGRRIIHGASNPIQLSNLVARHLIGLRADNDHSGRVSVALHIRQRLAQPEPQILDSAARIRGDGVAARVGPADRKIEAHEVHTALGRQKQLMRGVVRRLPSKVEPQKLQRRVGGKPASSVFVDRNVAGVGTLKSHRYDARVCVPGEQQRPRLDVHALCARRVIMSAILSHIDPLERTHEHRLAHAGVPNDDYLAAVVDLELAASKVALGLAGLPSHGWHAHNTNGTDVIGNVLLASNDQHALVRQRSQNGDCVAEEGRIAAIQHDERHRT
mmetsp:Transcript_11925/g.41839  ORF Transcript_11925/g.41839 Transcript_11925/m.41839 type:complete len:402 (-) Transcript_11925:412-1617(-)